MGASEEFDRGPRTWSGPLTCPPCALPRPPPSLPALATVLTTAGHLEPGAHAGGDCHPHPPPVKAPAHAGHRQAAPPLCLRQRHGHRVGPADVRRHPTPPNANRKGGHPLPLPRLFRTWPTCFPHASALPRLIRTPPTFLSPPDPCGLANSHIYAATLNPAPVNFEGTTSRIMTAIAVRSLRLFAFVPRPR